MKSIRSDSTSMVVPRAIGSPWQEWPKTCRRAAGPCEMCSRRERVTPPLLRVSGRRSRIGGQALQLVDVTDDLDDAAVAAHHRLGHDVAALEREELRVLRAE